MRELAIMVLMAYLSYMLAEVNMFTWFYKVDTNFNFLLKLVSEDEVKPSSHCFVFARELSFAASEYSSIKILNL